MARSSATACLVAAIVGYVLVATSSILLLDVLGGLLLVLAALGEATISIVIGVRRLRGRR